MRKVHWFHLTTQRQDFLEMSSSSTGSMARETQDHVLDIIDDIRYSVRVLNRTQRMTQDRIDGVVRQLKRLRKDVAK